MTFSREDVVLNVTNTGVGEGVWVGPLGDGWTESVAVLCCENLDVYIHTTIAEVREEG